MKKIKYELSRSTWEKTPRARLISEINLNNWGSDELFIDDINNDGIPELLWFQNQGIFKSDIYQKKYGEKFNFLEYGRGLDCLTVTDIQGEVLWQTGKPYKGNQPFCCHASEKLLTVFQTQDGDQKVAVLAPSNIFRVLDGKSGKIEHEMTLPEDNYSLIETITSSLGIVFIVGVMDSAIEPHHYGNPTLILNSTYEIIKKLDLVGSGHQVWVHDFNRDGENEIMIGYQALKPDGEIVWTMDYWANRKEVYNAYEQHVDSISPIKIGDKLFAAIAGSDRLYWINEQGNVIWQNIPRHAQFVLVGNFKGQQSMPNLILVESKHGTKLSGFSLEGTKQWEKENLMYWPEGKPLCMGRRSSHMGIPIVKWKSPDKGPDLAIYFEEGWPLGLNGDGKVAVMFPFPPGAQKPEIKLPIHRPNDFGYNYQARCADVDCDGEQEVLIYDRRKLWIYKLSGLTFQ